ncbi:MAG TPA: hypothetical protein VF817_00750 [Patescibacteria group bacterium]
MFWTIVDGIIPFSPFGIPLKKATQSQVIDLIYSGSRELMRSTKTNLSSDSIREREFTELRKLEDRESVSVWFSREDDISNNTCTVRAFVLPLEIFGCQEAFEEKSIMRATYVLH